MTGEEYERWNDLRIAAKARHMAEMLEDSGSSYDAEIAALLNNPAAIAERQADQ